MAYTKQVWTDRDVQYPNRYTLTNVSGTTYDIARAEGTVNEAGTLFNAAKMNNLEDGVEANDIAIATKQPAILIYSTTLASATSSVTISNLDIAAHGGVYEIIMSGSTAGAVTIINIRPNNDNSNYYGYRKILQDTRTTSGDLVTGSNPNYYYHNEAPRCGIWGTGMSYLRAIITQNAGLDTTINTEFNSVASGYQALGNYHQSKTLAANITSIVISSSANMSVGTTIKIYRK